MEADEFGFGERELRSGVQVCRTYHSCEGCPRALSLSPGEKSWVRVVVVDGRFEATRTCVDARCWIADAEAEMARVRAQQAAPLQDGELAF